MSRTPRLSHAANSGLAFTGADPRPWNCLQRQVMCGNGEMKGITHAADGQDLSGNICLSLSIEQIQLMSWGWESHNHAHVYLQYHI